jgi:anti-sigma factor RsiW
LTEQNEHPLEFLPELALEALEEREAPAVRAHLATCETCRSEFEEMERVARLLPLAAEDVGPEPSVKAGLMERIAAEPRVVPFSGRGRSRWQWLAATAAAAAVFLTLGAVLGVAFGGNDDSALQRDVSRQGRLVQAVAEGTAARDDFQSGGMQAVVLRARESHEAFAWLQGLPPLPAGKAYQAWFTKDGMNMEPSAVFRSPGGVWLPAGGKLEEFVAMGLTIEDEDGASAPTQAPFMVVPFKQAALEP